MWKQSHLSAWAWTGPFLLLSSVESKAQRAGACLGSSPGHRWGGPTGPPETREGVRALTGRPACPPASGPWGSSAGPRCRSAGPSSAPPDASLRPPEGRAVLMPTGSIRAAADARLLGAAGVGGPQAHRRLSTDWLGRMQTLESWRLESGLRLPLPSCVTAGHPQVWLPRPYTRLLGPLRGRRERKRARSGTGSGTWRILNTRLSLL